MRFACLLVAALLPSACLSARYSEGAAIPWQYVDRIEPGTTTKSQVLDWFGAPENFSNPSALVEFLEANGLESESYARYPFTDVFVYELRQGELEAWSLLLYSRLKLEIASDALVILFDERDRVRHVGVRRAPPRDD